MADDPNETDAEQRHRLWWGIVRRGLVQLAAMCIVLAMVAALFWAAIHYSESPGFCTPVRSCATAAR
jgi:hypothetical protein